MDAADPWFLSIKGGIELPAAGGSLTGGRS
jgi:hypothetical protein